MDEEAAEARYQLAAPEDMTPEKVFEARWAATLIDTALQRLRAEMEAEAKGRAFDTLQPFLLGGKETSYQEAADALGMSLGALKTAIHRLRSRYGALLREEVARTVSRPEQVDDELRCLRDALRG